MLRYISCSRYFCGGVNGRVCRGQTRQEKLPEVQIKSFVGNDDFRAMQEVVNRRYARLAAEGKFPDLVVVDGGLGQVTSAKKSFPFARS